ncbi:hypothetical protein SAMN02745947_02752 [Rhodococcus rhodochrous J3]|uniref:Integral membrane protein n=2 Tax=Rhodococcus rhodochrous TaxID=1829 RepID=A0AA47ACQ1_RHORH|nr:hypothetical protein [Rhodococcus rhodochrous]AYA25323.1 hypothetical protein C6369_013105 [Rhodococcus rhodochrous]MBF4478495.1 hypothetical protein [Rhodococcus rhodochrous]MCB8913023.1 hypothetical protein [Rhodococcus rhodochrous]TWH53179.1 hypothetical protein L612_000200004960 [Rhodococcus rhodochrous J38]UZF46087.1 hypothetical protein KUM34_005230 [Rhodococcus rhodochrous]
MEADSLLHGPLFSRRRPLDRENAARRISAYIYGNVLVLTALVPIAASDQHVGILVVLGVALSTFVAHVFAEAVGQSVQTRSSLSRPEKLRELRDSVPILTSAVLPCAILMAALLGLLEPRTAQIVAELAVLARIGGIVWIIGRLKGERPTRASIVAAFLLTLVATTVVIVKIMLTH